MELMTPKQLISPFEIGAGSSTVRSADKIGAGSSTVGPGARIGAGSSIVNGRDPRIAIIERQRVSFGLSHADLCSRAGVRKDTWQEIRAGRRSPLARTLDKLEAALADKPRRRPPHAVKALHQRTVLDLCKQLRAPLSSVLAQDMTAQRPSNKAWLQAARINRMAIYIVAVELVVGNAELARALGCTRQNIKQARDDVFDWMEDSRKIARAIALVSAGFTGKAE